jgi:hypothetical protein
LKHWSGKGSLFPKSRFRAGRKCPLFAVTSHQRRRSAYDAFPAGTSWLCYTDQVVHAAVAGQYALKQNSHFDIASMADPARSPVQELERMTEQQLR